MNLKDLPEAREVVFVFPSLPPRELHPNHRRSNFWAQRSGAAKAAREEAMWTAFLRKGVGGKPIQRCEIEEIFTVPTRRRMDVEGLIAASKAWVDGLVSAGVLEDDNWTVVTRLSGKIVYIKGASETRIIVRER